MAMKERHEAVEGGDPHETYGVQRVPKSRAEALGQAKEELRREMARRAGSYGRRLIELMEDIETARRAFDEDLEMVRASVVGRFGIEAARWSWGELVARVDTPASGGKGSLASAVRSLERSAARHRGLRAEWKAVLQHLIIHREAMGFRRHHLVEEKFPPPRALPPLEAAWRRTFAELEGAAG